MFQKLSILIIVLAGFFLIGKGIVKWNKQGEVRTTVDQFANSLIQGDRKLFLSTLHEDLKKHFLENEDPRSKFLPLPNAIYRVQFIKLDDQLASSQILINGDGFVIKPSMTLKKDQNSIWKISSIEQKNNKLLGPHVDYDTDLVPKDEHPSDEEVSPLKSNHNKPTEKSSPLKKDLTTTL